MPGPELKWEKMASAPVPRLDGAAIQMKNLLYVFAGYGTIDYVRICSCSYTRLCTFLFRQIRDALRCVLLYIYIAFFQEQEDFLLFHSPNIATYFLFVLH